MLTQIEILRVSVARVAQAAGVSLDRFRIDDDAPYEVLIAAAIEYERGWNVLAGETADAVNRLRDEVAMLREEVQRLEKETT